MKKIYLILAAAVGMTITSCTSNDFLGDVDPNAQAINDGAIHFGTAAKGMTRADFKGAEAAEKLNGKFVVTGFKGEETATNTSTSIVFDNYLVEYEKNSANKTESNSSNWEYVGKTPIAHATTNGISTQSIKYWDYSVPQYDFIAWGMGKVGDDEITPIYDNATLSGHQVRVSAIKPNSKDGWGTERMSYTFEGKAEDLSQCYISDLVTVKKGTAGTYGEVSGYNKPVTLTFRQLGTKVRIGIYETVPGYSVKEVEFYSAAASDDASTSGAKIFTTVENGIYKEGTYTVYFPTVDSPDNADNNQAHIDFAPKSGADQKTTVDWGGLNYTYRERGEKETDPVYLGRSSNTASFAGDADANYYVVYLPNQNGTNLNLRVNYTLESVDGSKETITVKGATAQVPSIYTQWKPGYAYTYLFKISDKTNGHTGDYDPLHPDDIQYNSDPAGLYPITFDAVVVNAEDNDATQSNSQETITTVSAPSITTYQKGSTVVNKNEYDHATGPIFVTVNDGINTYEEVTGLTDGDDVSKYYIKEIQKTYGLATGTAQSGITYYSDENGTLVTEEIVPDVTNVSGYYVVTSEEDVYKPASGTYNSSSGIKYYSMNTTTVENGKVVTLYTNSTAISVDNQANLFTLPTDKAYTEADVVDALQLQDDDASAGTIKGRSGLELTPASFSLETSIEYGVDGNAISLSELPYGPGGTYSANAMKFTAGAAGTYAFVYTKQASTATTNKYQPVTKTVGEAVGANVYRYALITGTTGDVEKGVTYFAKNDGTEGSITAFLGQNVSNLYLDDAGTQASGLAKTGTSYWYSTDNGLTFKQAHNVAYSDFKDKNYDLYKEADCNSSSKLTEAEHNAGPVNGQAYYWKDTNDIIYYCVILPQRAETLFVIDTNEANVVEVTSTANAVTGMIYLDKYTQNNGVYYVKVIKVQ